MNGACYFTTPNRSSKMINCKVEQDKMGNLTVTFTDGLNMYLQDELSKANFGIDAGLIIAPKGWLGLVDNLPDKWWDVDFESITECADDYYEIAAVH